MNLRSCFIIVSVIVICSRKSNQTGDSDDIKTMDMLPTQKRLFNDLFQNYSKNEAPILIGQNKQFFDVSVGNVTWSKWFFILVVERLKVIQLDEPKEEITVATHFMQNWMEQRLAWNSSLYDDIWCIYVPKSMIWNPSLVVPSASDVKNHEEQELQVVQLCDTGDIFSPRSLTMTTNCNFHMENFPFDNQTCEIHFNLGGYDYNSYSLNLSLPDEHRDSYCEMGNSGWDVINITQGTAKLPFYTFTYARFAVVRLTLKRNPLFYVYMIILPTFIINLIAISGVFMVKATPMERLTVGFTHIMTMTFILGLISEKIPKTKEVPLLGKYIILGLGLMIVAMIVSSGLKKFCNFTDSRRFPSIKSLSICFVLILQVLNITCFVYMLYRYVEFERAYGGYGNCSHAIQNTSHVEYSEMTHDKFIDV